MSSLTVVVGRNVSGTVNSLLKPHWQPLYRSVQTLASITSENLPALRSENFYSNKRSAPLCHVQQQRQPQRYITSIPHKLRVEVATPKHAKDIEEFMLSDFGRDEPITKSLNVTREDVLDFFRDISEAGYSNEKYSTVVYDGKRLIAICLCSVSDNTDNPETTAKEIDVDYHDFAQDISKGPYKQQKANQLFTYVTTLEHRQKLLLGSNSKVFKINILCVNENYRRRGIATELAQKAVELARSERCDWVATAATALASQEIFLRMRFNTIYEIPYKTFLENGRAVFRNLHDYCQSGRFMALRLRA
ncbi:hypothetical protein Y032_0046g1401 [Ancylostoma ceylanicum]|uniref:aralkylamine N-acetyltransferase n=1 Tax=Ancylostoma ceylanicum TaxID=53326 RepID=A0A016UCT4_9BILA|nr:hypothetical protein Y032_0046g1401 [Ancylostoma ceylanicum]